jgi:hypothetical protein
VDGFNSGVKGLTAIVNMLGKFVDERLSYV